MTAEKQELPDWAELPLFAPAGAEVPELGDGAPSGSVETPSALAALSHLLHDEETPEEASDLLRDQGNRNLKYGKHGTRLAIKKYSEAIAAAEGNVPATAAALANRSAAELKLGNLGRALKDAEESLRLQPAQVKAHYRAALCATKLGRIGPARRHCTLGKECSTTPADVKAFDVLLAQLRVAERHARARATREAAEAAARGNARTMMERRRLRRGPPAFSLQTEYGATEPVYERDVDEWVWPVLLVYVAPDGEPQSDYLQAVGEGARMRDIVHQVFGAGAEPPEWDREGWYRDEGALEVRFRAGGKEWRQDDRGRCDQNELVGGEDDNEGEWVPVRADTTLGQLLDGGDYVVPLYPVLHVVPKWWR